MKRRVVITGLGCVSGLGEGLTCNWQRAAAGESAIRRLDRPGMAGIAAWIEAPEHIGNLEAWERAGKLDPLSRYALAASMEAVAVAGLQGHPSLKNRTAVLLGCGSGGNATQDIAYERLYARKSSKVHPQTIPSSMISAPAARVAMMLGVHGPTFVLSSACASSAHALGEAMHMIRAGRVDVAIAGGAEACLSPGSWTAWQSLGVLAQDNCRPFSKDRAGMVLGEGAAVLVLEDEEHARSRGAEIWGELAGYGASSDASHITAPGVDGIVMAIEAAHLDSGIHIATPALISAHGTGTALNDSVESTALHAVYGACLNNHAVIATKSAHGHMVGGTGAMEFLLGMMALREGFAPPVLNYLGADPHCELPLVLQPARIDHKILVSNSFAFGGLNAVLIGVGA